MAKVHAPMSERGCADRGVERIGFVHMAGNRRGEGSGGREQASMRGCWG